MSKNVMTALKEYEDIMGRKLSEGQRIIFIAGYNFALIDNKLMSCQKVGDTNDV
jgi:hypothetical protein